MFLLSPRDGWCKTVLSFKNYTRVDHVAVFTKRTSIGPMCSGFLRLCCYDDESSLTKNGSWCAYVCASAIEVVYRACLCLLLKLRNYHFAWLCTRNLMSSFGCAGTGTAWRQLINTSLLRGVSCLSSSYNVPGLSKQLEKKTMIFASPKRSMKLIHVSVFFSVSRLDYVSVDKRWRSRSYSRSFNFSPTDYVLFCLLGFVITTVHLTCKQVYKQIMRVLRRWT